MSEEQEGMNPTLTGSSSSSSPPLGDHHNPLASRATLSSSSSSMPMTNSSTPEEGGGGGGGGERMDNDETLIDLSTTAAHPATETTPQLPVSPTQDSTHTEDMPSMTAFPNLTSPSGRTASTGTTTTGSSTGTATTASADASNLGAQLLRNRFLSLKERANQNAQTLWAINSPALSENAKAVQERAGLLWKTASSTAPTVVAGFRMPPAPPGLFSTVTTTTATTTTTQPPPPQQPKKTESEKVPSSSTYTPTEEGRPLEKVAELQPRQLSLEGPDHHTTATTKDDKGEYTEGAATSATTLTAGFEAADDDTSSMGGASDVASLLLTGRALTRASLVASVAFESSVATFRGRYNAAAAAAGAPPTTTTTTSASTPTRSGTTRSEDETVTDNRPLPESQIEIILKSRVGQYMQEILDQLEPHEFAMLLGRGMLGVNLKQCYLKNHGVFIDFMVPGGQAANSGVIRSGDLPVRLGDIDLRKGTILDIPAQISQARRPAVLTFATGSTVSLERLNYVDVAVAMMHRARAYYTKRGTLSNLPSATSPPRGDSTRSATTATADSEIKSVSDVTIPPADTIDGFLTPPAPNMDIRQAFLDEVPLRNLDKFLVEGLTQVYDLDSNFREVTRNAFLTCALDGRRLLFLSRHFSSGDQALADMDPKITPSAQLMLFLELSSFLDLYHVTPISKLRLMASKIAFKFFLPTTVGSKLQLPLFDFHHIVPDASLRHLELVLNAKSQSIPRDLFMDFSKAIVDSVAGAPFLSFLTSTECSRMRAYLRNTAPYVNLPLHELMDAMTIGDTNHLAAAKNCFSYLLLFLICHVEKEPAGECNFSSEEETKIRLLGAPNDMCCAIFIRRTLIPALEAVNANLTATPIDQQCDASIVEMAVHAIEHFWDNFIIGAVEPSSRRDEVEAPLKSVRTELERVATELLVAGEGSIPSSRVTGEIIMKSKLLDGAKVLADEMVFNFAANVNPKFREHKFHEWMCNELSKLRAKDTTWRSQQEIPTLPQGCVKRLLRKADLPDGVSPHKPHRETTDESDEETHYPNAEFAVVFGSSVGNELSLEMQIPRSESTNIRRYTCLPVALNTDHEVVMSKFAADEIIPPTFEGYAAVPSQKPKPFQRFMGDCSVSKDGWEVSLISFTIPNAESSGASSALYGVSLFLQCKPDQVQLVEERIGSFVCDGEPTSEAFVSPIKMTPVETTDSGVPVGDLANRGFVKSVSVVEPLPTFNDQLKSASWVSRVMGEEGRDSSQPLSIGLALVSRKNVILAMRDALSRLLFDYSRDRSTNTSTLGKCGPLVDVLGNFANPDVESISLRCMLEPYLRAASAPWIDRPISIQANLFESRALHLVSDCLPPTPLALLFITALLEQKIILASSRRSILQSCTTSIGTLLAPLKWSHLMVPMVPATLAGDLVQYPAPFILGVPSEEAENEELIANLPRDITLVDLDVGRVILAPDFGLDNEMVRKSEDPADTASALRAQVLYLAQTLGSIFGSSMKPETWMCDRVLPPGTVPVTESPPTDIEGLKQAAKSFVEELLEGVCACSYWIEEATQADGVTSEPTVLFDEDKFFEIKNHRARVTHKTLFPKTSKGELALNLNDFDLVLESFLRCQSMSTYISSRPKTDMVFY